jgi:arylsulfatase A-like enzyme
MFERGISGHSTDALYQPVIRIPLMIFEPGRKEGMDIYDVTSAVDVVPTLAHIAGEKAPDWTEGVILPPFASEAQFPDRNIYVIRAHDNQPDEPLKIASTVAVRENYKLHYYFGYPEVPSDGLVRLYDIRSDPEEMNDLALTKPETTSELLHELKGKLKEADEPYM